MSSLKRLWCRRHYGIFEAHEWHSRCITPPDLGERRANFFEILRDIAVEDPV